MSGKNRRNNNQRQQESDGTIASVQCDGLVSIYLIKSVKKIVKIYAYKYALIVVTYSIDDGDVKTCWPYIEFFFFFSNKFY